MKKAWYEMHGRLLRPLLVGKPAWFLAAGRVHCTLPVVHVEYADSACVCFETRNGRYSLSTPPIPPAAAGVLPAKLAACA